jgi:hypothetical protein
MIVGRGLAAWPQCLVANDPYIWLAARAISFVYVCLDASPQSIWDQIFLGLNEAGHRRPPIAAIAQPVEPHRSLANECSVEMSWPHDSRNEVVSANRTRGSTIDGVLWGFKIPPIINPPCLNATPQMRVRGRIWRFPKAECYSIMVHLICASEQELRMCRYVYCSTKCRVLPR